MTQTLRWTRESLEKMSKAELVEHILTETQKKMDTVNSVKVKLTEVENELTAEKKVNGPRVKSLQSQCSRLRKHIKLLTGEVYTDSNVTRSEEITPELMVARITESQEQITQLKPEAETSLKAYKKIASLQSRISVSRKKWKELTGETECPV